MTVPKPKILPNNSLHTDTPGFLALIKDSKGRNRGPTEAIVSVLDPNGYHIVAFRMPHNDVEWRCQWLVKVLGSMEPVPLWMDNSFEAFASATNGVK